MIARPRPVRRFLTRALRVVGVIGGLFGYFVCQGMFAGYPRYHTDVLSIIGMILIAATGGVAWIIDERRSDADG
jgi:H+/Cl- antiporter ClcA